MASNLPLKHEPDQVPHHKSTAKLCINWLHLSPPSIDRMTNQIHYTNPHKTKQNLRRTTMERERGPAPTPCTSGAAAPRGSFLVLHLVGGRRKEKVNGKGKRQPIYHITTQLVHQTDRCGPAFTITRESIRDADLRTDGPEHGLMDKQNIKRLTWSKSDIENISSVN